MVMQMVINSYGLRTSCDGFQGVTKGARADGRKEVSCWTYEGLINVRAGDDCGVFFTLSIAVEFRF